MNEELKDLVEDIEVKEEKVQEEEDKILEKITGIQIEDKKVCKNQDCFISDL